MNVEEIIANVPDSLQQKINEKFSEAVQIHKEYKAKDKSFGDYMDARDSIYRIVFPLFVRSRESTDSGMLLEGWVLTTKALDITVERDGVEKAELRSYIKNLSEIRNCEIEFDRERYEYMKKKTHFGKGRMPNRYQRAGMVKNGLNPYEYLVVKETPECLYIKHKDNEKIQTIRY